MVRFAVGLAAWTAGTVIAVCVAWLGANVVVRNAGVGVGMPVLNAAVLPSSATSSSPATPLMVPSAAGAAPTGTRGTGNGDTGAVGTGTGEAPPAHAAASGTDRPGSGSAPSPSASAPAGQVHAYTLTGGTVTLEMTDTSVQLVTAVPNAGYSVQTWSGTGWLRVDFSSGPQVSSLIASWYEHAPSITVEN